MSPPDDPTKSPQHIRLSNFLSLVLRHAPEKAGLVLDSNGWCDVDALLAGLSRVRHSCTRAELEEVVGASDKQRFALSTDGLRIRANQGHSLELDLALAPAEPPEYLYHGTADRNLDSIRRDSLRKGGRQHVHLSDDPEIARRVGARHGRPVILTVASGNMSRAGIFFYRSENGVWLVDAVPGEHLTFP